MNKLISLMFAAALSFALPAFAMDADSGHHCERMGKSASATMPADTDNDGTVDWEEAHDAFVKHFDEMDANQDGVLDANETKGCCCMQGKHCKDGGEHKCKDGKCKRHNAAHDKGSKAFDAADKDHDGTLDKKEARKLKNVFKNFDVIDADHDGTVDREEVHQYMHDRAIGK